MEQLSFSETRYINAHMDYGERLKNKAYFNRCYELPGNRLSIYDKQVENGIVKLFAKKAQKITMIAKDANDNTATLEFWVKRKEVSANKKGKSFNYTFPYNQVNSLNREDLNLSFPKGCFYENLYFKYEIQGTDNGFYAPIHRIHNEEIPVHKYFSIGIKPSRNIPENLRRRAYIAHIDDEGTLVNCGGNWKNGKLYTKVRKLGDYSICIDDTPPTVTAIKFSSNMKGYNRMSFKVVDNMDVGGKGKGLSFSASVDGKWILMEHDGKKDLYTHEFDGRIKAGTHQLKIIAKDNRGNTTVYQREFIR